ncbi:MAG: F0F1 ATP synthase subunit B [Eubacteriales bacterium]|nr:F0F1 ATP synthase subunit B [Eubacteriales bacterium]
MHLMEIQVHSVPDPIHMVLVWISVIILYFILKHFLHKPIKEFLQKREELVLGGIAKAEAERAEAEELKSQYEAKLAAARDEGAKIVEDYRERGEAMRDKLVADAEEESKLILERTDREVERRQSQAMSEVQAEAGNLAVNLASKLLRDKLGKSEAQQALVDSFINDLERQ